MKVVGTKNLKEGKTYFITTNHRGIRLVHWKKNGKFIHPLDDVWVEASSPGYLKPNESFTLIEQTKLLGLSKWIKIVTNSGVTGWMSVDEYDTFFLANETLEIGKLYTTIFKSLPRDCIMMQQVIRTKPTSHAQRIAVECWQDCFVLLGYNNDGHWMKVLTGTGNVGWVRNNIEIELVEQS